MPKDGRVRCVSFERSRASPFFCTTKNIEEYKSKKPVGSNEEVKEWEEARCPICMEHPHNAVLLLCSSHEKGCRPYMCNTSYRHSNCLDQFCKSADITPSTFLPQEVSTSLSTMFSIRHEDHSFLHSLPREASHHKNHFQVSTPCPLCRGQISGWVVVDAARAYMNSKQRSCSNETCDFIGAYSELRKHARHNHPYARPSDVDPTRERDWRRLERETNYRDILSMAQPVSVDGLFRNSFLPNFEFAVDTDAPNFESSGLDDMEQLGSIIRETLLPLQVGFLVTIVGSFFNATQIDEDLSLTERGQLQNRRSDRIGERMSSAASESVHRMYSASERLGRAYSPPIWRNNDSNLREQLRRQQWGEQGLRGQQQREQRLHGQQQRGQGSHRQQQRERGLHGQQQREQGLHRQQQREPGLHRQLQREPGFRWQQQREQWSHREQRREQESRSQRRLQLREQGSSRQQHRWNDSSRRS